VLLVVVGGLAPGTPARLVLFSAPYYDLGTSIVPADGTLTATAPLPEGIAAGRHMLQLDAVRADLDGPDAPQDDPPTAGPHLAMDPGPSEAPAEHPVPVPVAHTAMSAAFTGLLSDLDACVAAERRIQRDIVPDALAPECAEDLRAAEAARENLVARLAEVLDQPVARALDRPLGLLARDLDALLSMEDDGDRLHLHGLMVRNADLLLVRGGAPAARRVRALQARFFQSLARLMALEDYGGSGPGPEDDGPDGPGPAA
jgi:hypothetical protein